MDSPERAYTTKEISLTLDIGTSTLRKWCIALEENGYQFIRNEQNGRSFIESDLIALKHFKHLVQKENFKLDNAAKIVTSKYNGRALPIESPPVLPEPKESERDNERSNELLEELLERANKQEEFNQEIVRFNRELMQRLDDQQNYIEERLNKRDEMLMQSLKESMETRKLIAAAKEEEERKKGFWARLFGR